VTVGTFKEDIVKTPIVNIADVALADLPEVYAPKGVEAEIFSARTGSVLGGLGARRLGCSLIVVAPGKRAYPFHNHHANEEMFFILSGTGEVRIGDAVYPIGSDDVISCPPGGRETAHQIINTGEVDLRYLAISTRIFPDVAEYPDSGKYGVLSEVKAGEAVRRMMVVGREDEGLEYWEGNR